MAFYVWYRAHGVALATWRTLVPGDGNRPRPVCLLRCSRLLCVPAMPKVALSYLYREFLQTQRSSDPLLPALTTPLLSPYVLQVFYVRSRLCLLIITLYWNRPIRSPVLLILKAYVNFNLIVRSPMSWVRWRGSLWTRVWVRANYV